MKRTNNLRHIIIFLIFVLSATVIFKLTTLNDISYAAPVDKIQEEKGIGNYPYASAEQKLIQDYNVKHSKATLANEMLFIVFLDDHFDAQQNVTSTFILRIFDKNFGQKKEVALSKSDVAAGGYDITYDSYTKQVVIVWEEYLDEKKTSKNIYLQSFDTAGETVQKKTQINQDDLGLFGSAVTQHRTPRLALNKNGVAYITWIGADEKGWNYCVYAQKIDSKRKKVGQNVRITECSNDTISKSGANVAFARGNFFFAWEFSKKIYAQTVSVDFVAQSEFLDSYNPIRIDDNTASQRNAKVLTDGELFFVLYEDFRDYPSAQQVRMRPFYTSGTPVIDSLLIDKLLNLRGYETEYSDRALYTTLFGHENPTGSDHAYWQVHLLFTDLETLKTTSAFKKELAESDTNIRSSIVLDTKDVYLTWKEDRPGANATPGVNENITDLLIKNYSAEKESQKTCTEDDWTATEFTPKTCPDTGVQTRTWTKKGECEGGISHPQTEEKVCFFQANLADSQTYRSLQGKIILRVEKKGEAYYVNSSKRMLHYLGRPQDAFRVMREQGIGIGNKELIKIPFGWSELSGKDKDGDGLSDELEDTIGTNKGSKDTDKDGFSDKTEMQNGYSPTAGSGTKLPIDMNYAAKHRGKIFLQVENNGEAWYTHVLDHKRYFLARPDDAFRIMRAFGLGIAEKDFSRLLGK